MTPARRRDHAEKRTDSRSDNALPSIVRLQGNSYSEGLILKEVAVRGVTVTFTALTLVLAPGGAAIAQAPVAYRVLFLGNSVFGASGGILQPFEGFCAAVGLDCEAVSQNGASPTVDHGIEFLGLGRVPLRLPDMARTAWIHSLIESGGFDYVILDERRPGYLLPDWVGAFGGGPQDPYEVTLAALTEIHRTIVESGAQMVLLAKSPPRNFLNWAQPMTQIVKRLGADLERVEIKGERHPVLVVPAGSLWLDALNQFGGVEAWYSDRFHGNQLAQYASACMIFTYLTGRDPRQNPFRDLGRLWESPENSPTEQVAEEAAVWIKNQVWLYYTTRH